MEILLALKELVILVLRVDGKKWERKKTRRRWSAKTRPKKRWKYFLCSGHFSVHLCCFVTCILMAEKVKVQLPDNCLIRSFKTIVSKHGVRFLCVMAPLLLRGAPCTGRYIVGQLICFYKLSRLLIKSCILSNKKLTANILPTHSG